MDRIFQAGDLVDERYVIEGVLGHGGMGVVYVARDRVLGRSVAVKVLPERHWQDAAAVERFLRQARTLAAIPRHTTVQIYDQGEHAPGVPYIVMERLRGRDLRQLLQQGRLPLQRALSIGVELCEAVSAVHREGVLHRDIKPSNVFLVDDDPVAALRLLDFGLARSPNEPAMTETGGLFGTLPYLAPEVLASMKQVSPRSDLYSVGCTLYELVTGQPAFHAHSPAALRAMIENDPPILPSTRAEGIPRGLDELLLAALAKRPEQRPRDLEALAKALAEFAPDPAFLPRPARRASETLGAGRFRLLERLGAGRFGVVWSALDTRHNQKVALKELKNLSGEQLLLLKREFRSVRELSHPHLVRLHELYLDQDSAFFTMELVEGAGLLEYLSQFPARAPRVLEQVASALAALHARGLVHRDLSPFNVLVTRSERVVLLDFGLCVREGSESLLAGTPPYIAPEVFEGRIGPEQDLFALGMILHQALTGAAQSDSSAEPAPRFESVLWPLCQSLIAAEPSARGSAEQLRCSLSRLALRVESPNSFTLTPAENPEPPFVGRQAELGLLREALANVSTRGLTPVFVCGPSGIGKSRLLSRLPAELGKRALFLASCCRESELIPYPALDAAIDALTEHVASLSTADQRNVLGRDAEAVSALFPVFSRFHSAGRKLAARDPVELRLAASAALRRVLRRLGEHTELVLSIDDLQWIDEDSATLLSHVFAEPDPPQLLFVGGRRSDVQSSPALSQLLERLAGRVTQLSLNGLGDEERRELARALLTRSPLSERAITHVAAQSGGNPFFLAALAAHAPSASNAAPPTLASALLALVHALPEPAQRLLSLASLCERPLAVEVLQRAAGVDDPSAVRALFASRLVRWSTRTSGARSIPDGIEPCHAELGAAVSSELEPEARRAAHGRLAEALEASAHEIEARIEHLAASGQGERAARLALDAAELAGANLAFDRAGALLEFGLERGTLERKERIDGFVTQATWWRRAGRNVEAARALKRAGALAGPDGERWLRDAGELLLLAGEVNAALELLVPLLARAGLDFPEDSARALEQGRLAYEDLARRELDLGPPRRASEQQREQFELCLVIANGLSLIDMRGVPYAIRSVALALELGEPEPLQRASAAFVSLTASLFQNPLLKPVLNSCRELTARLETPYARALLQQAEGEFAFYGGNFLAAESAFERAEQLLLEGCVGASRELAAARNGLVLIEYAQKGDFASQLERTLAWQADAEARGDVFHTNVLRVAHSIVWIAKDDPARARSELERAGRLLPERASAYQVGRLLFADVADRYEGDDEAHRHPLQGELDLLRSPAAHTPFLAGYVELQRAWGSIRKLARGRHVNGERELAREAVQRLRELGPDVWRATAAAYEANLLFLAGQRDDALSELQRAERGFRALHMPCLAACARLRHGELAGGNFGERLIAEGQRELEALGVARPFVWSSAYFSLFEAEAGSALTLTNA